MIIANSLQENKPLTISYPISERVQGLPYIGEVSCGFPNQADEYLNTFIDLNIELVNDKDATVYARVNGNSMMNAGFENGDVLIIDRGLEFQHGKIVVCIIDGELLCKRLSVNKKTKTVMLMAENEDYPPITVSPENERFMVYGTVTYIIKKVR